MLPAKVLAALLMAPPPAPPPPPAAPATSSSDLSAEAPVPSWSFEGGGETGVEDDASKARKQVRKAGATAIAGASVAIVGLGAAVAGGVMLGLGSKERLAKMRTDNDGTLPTDDAKRQRTVVMARTGPIVTGVGAGVFVVGAIVALVGRKRLRRLRDDRRASTVAFGAMPTLQGATFQAEVRF